MSGITFSQSEQVILDRFRRSRALREDAKTLSQKKKPLVVRHQDITRLYLDGLKLPKSDFYRASGLMVYARNSNLRRSNFEEARLWSPFFLKSDFRQCNFQKAFMPYASFWHSDVRGSDFRGANLDTANFEGADVSGCKWDGAMLDGVRGLHENPTFGKTIITL